MTYSAWIFGTCLCFPSPISFPTRVCCFSLFRRSPTYLNGRCTSRGNGRRDCTRAPHTGWWDSVLYLTMRGGASNTLFLSVYYLLIWNFPLPPFLNSLSSGELHFAYAGDLRRLCRILEHLLLDCRPPRWCLQGFIFAGTMLLSTMRGYSLAQAL